MRVCGVMDVNKMLTEKKVCVSGPFLTSRFERFSLSVALRLPYIQIILDLCKVVNLKAVVGG